MMKLLTLAAIMVGIGYGEAIKVSSGTSACSLHRDVLTLKNVADVFSQKKACEMNGRSHPWVSIP